MSGPIRPHRPDPQRGSQVYFQNCAGCHESGRGSARSIYDFQEWNLRELMPAPVFRDHSARGWLGSTAAAGPPVSEADVADAVLFMSRQIASEDDAE